MTFWILLVIALTVSYLSLKYRNILFSLGGSLGWLALWAYHQTTPPAGIVQGTWVYELLMYVFIVMAIAVMLMWFRNRQRGYTGFPLTKGEEAEQELLNLAKGEEAEQESRYTSRRPRRGLMDLSPEEYKAVVRARLRRRRG